MPSKHKLALIDELTTSLEYWLMYYGGGHDGINCRLNKPGECKICQHCRLVNRIRAENRRHANLHEKALREKGNVR